LNIKEHLKVLSAKIHKISNVPQLEAEILVSFALGKPKEFLFSHPELELSTKSEKKLKSLLKRRLKHEPISYITGKKEFFGLGFQVNKSTLVPRPESEHLVEVAVDEIKRIIEVNRSNKVRKKVLVHELATGSGAIIISLANELKNLSGTVYSASDISVEAIKIAKKNSKNLLGNTKVSFRKLDILKSKKIPRADIIISNPPYIPTSKIKSLEQEVRDFEPKIALDGGKDGLKFYQAILEKSAKSSPKALILELESENSRKIESLAQKYFPDGQINLIKDLSGKDRVLLLRTSD